MVFAYSSSSINTAKYGLKSEYRALNKTFCKSRSRVFLFYTEKGGGSMPDNFGLKIGIEGEKDFKKALSDIDQSFKVLGSEMKLDGASYAFNVLTTSAQTGI